MPAPSRLIDRCNLRLGRVAAWLTLLMALATAAVVALRYAFGQNTILLQEGVVALHGLALMLGIAYTLLERGHVRVDILHNRLPERRRRMVDAFGHAVFLLPVAALMFVTSLPYVAQSWRVAEGSAEVGGLPGVYLLKTLIPLMALLLFAQGLSELMKVLRQSSFFIRTLRWFAQGLNELMHMLGKRK